MSSDIYHVHLDRKPVHLMPPIHHITEVIELPESEWMSFIISPGKSREWVGATEGVVLVRGPGGGEVLMDTQGFDYARYATRIR